MPKKRKSTRRKTGACKEWSKGRCKKWSAGRKRCLKRLKPKGKPRCLKRAAR